MLLAAFGYLQDDSALLVFGCWPLQRSGLSGSHLVNYRPCFICDDILAFIEGVKGDGFFFQRWFQLSDYFPWSRTPWTVAYQAPLSMEFSRQEYWSRQPFPSPWDLPNPGTKPMSPALQANSLLLSHQGIVITLCNYLFSQLFLFSIFAVSLIFHF